MLPEKELLRYLGFPLEIDYNLLKEGIENNRLGTNFSIKTNKDSHSKVVFNLNSDLLFSNPGFDSIVKYCNLIIFVGDNFLKALDIVFGRDRVYFLSYNGTYIVNSCEISKLDKEKLICYISFNGCSVQGENLKWHESKDLEDLVLDQLLDLIHKTSIILFRGVEETLLSSVDD
jgi:hypothetical protein